MREHLTGERLIGMRDGQLDPPLREAADAHLAECPACRERLAGVDRTFALLLEAKDDGPDEAFLDALERRILDAVRLEAAAAPPQPTPAAPGKTPSVWRAASRHAALAALAAAALFALIWPGFPKTTKPHDPPAQTAARTETVDFGAGPDYGLSFADLSEDEMGDLAAELADSANLGDAAALSVDLQVDRDFQVALARLSDDELADLAQALDQRGE